ncbi:MAG: hypothetical protein LW806_10675 [Planctomycetaceae bacterium]|nr:hypothetical protein [Planctomycetaceae bacterium]
MASPAPRRSLECPRCGHHLDGNADAAEARGETRGVCTECALPVEWSKLRADAIAPKWFVEAQHSKYWWPRRLTGTLLRCVRPFHFWSAIDLAIPFSRRGAIVFLIGVAALLHVVAVGQRLAYVGPACLDRFRWKMRNAETESAADIALAIVAPTARFEGSDILSWTRSEVGPGAASEVALRTAARFALIAISPMRREMSFGGAPTAWNPRGPTQITGRAPELFWPDQSDSTIASSIAAVLAPLAMLLLPTSLRRARIRPRHFVRVSLYASVLIVPIVATSLLLPHLGAMYGGSAISFINLYGQPNADAILLASATLFISIWMTAAAGRYLRLPHAAGVGLSCGLIAVLTSMLVLQWRWVM